MLLCWLHCSQSGSEDCKKCCEQPCFGEAEEGRAGGYTFGVSSERSKSAAAIGASLGVRLLGVLKGNLRLTQNEAQWNNRYKNWLLWLCFVAKTTGVLNLSYCLLIPQLQCLCQGGGAEWNNCYMERVIFQLHWDVMCWYFFPSLFGNSVDHRFQRIISGIKPTSVLVLKLNVFNPELATL